MVHFPSMEIMAFLSTERRWWYGVKRVIYLSLMKSRQFWLLLLGMFCATLNLAELQIQATSSQTEILVANDVQRLDTRSRIFLGW